jgi:hypothetical protein
MTEGEKPPVEEEGDGGGLAKFLKVLLVVVGLLFVLRIVAIAALTATSPSVNQLLNETRDALDQGND